MIKTKIKELRIHDGVWKCTVEYWYNCYCNHQKIEVAIQQEQRPTKLEILQTTKKLLTK